MKKKRSKKPRSAKQLANDKRLGELARARHAEQAEIKHGQRVIDKVFDPLIEKVRKKAARKKTARKKNPTRKTSLKKDHLWLVFKMTANTRRVLFLGPPTVTQSLWRPSKTQAVLFTTKEAAKNAAQNAPGAGGLVGIAPRSYTELQIRNECVGKT